MKRAERRHHRQRLKAKRRCFWGHELSRQELGKVVDTPAPCSCRLCRNWRTDEGPTVGERRFEAEPEE